MYCSVGVVSLSVRCVMVFGQECCWDAATAGFSIIEKMGNLLDKQAKYFGEARGIVPGIKNPIPDPCLRFHCCVYIHVSSWQDV